MSSISTWSKTAANNNAASPNGFPDGSTLAEVVSGAREVMAATRTWFETAEWLDFGHAPTRTGNTTFTIGGDVTAIYEVGRRIQCVDSSTMYGVITAVAFASSVTTVTVALNGGVLSVSLSAVAVAIASISKPGIQLPAGIIVPFGGGTVPSGWLLCDGANVSRATYGVLFAAIGTTHGSGDGSTTFGLPDLRGRAPFGKDNMGGSAANRVTSGVSGITGTTLGAAGGHQDIQQHSHDKNTNVSNVSAPATDFYLGDLYQTKPYGYGGPNFPTLPFGTGNAANMPPALIVNYIIKI